MSHIGATSTVLCAQRKNGTKNLDDLTPFLKGVRITDDKYIAISKYVCL